MYFSIFSSSEYYSDEEVKKSSINDEDVCLLCWLPSSKQDTLKTLSNFTNFKLNCNCNPKLHLTCINEWFHSTKSCPICRKKIDITVFIIENNDLLNNYLLNNYYIICVSNTIIFLKIICYTSFISLLFLFFLFFYNLISIYYSVNNILNDYEII